MSFQCNASTNEASHIVFRQQVILPTRYQWPAVNQLGIDPQQANDQNRLSAFPQRMWYRASKKKKNSSGWPYVRTKTIKNYLHNRWRLLRLITLVFDIAIPSSSCLLFALLSLTLRTWTCRDTAHLAKWYPLAEDFCFYFFTWYLSTAL